MGTAGAPQRKSTSAHEWEGCAQLKKALEGLACAKGTSANRVKAVATTALQFAKDYKRVVHDVEVFLWKADAEHRLAGLYAMDAIMRQSQAKNGAKDQFVARFGLHLSHTISAVKKVPAEFQSNVTHVVEEWQTRGFYTSEQVEQAGGRDYSLNNRTSERPSNSSNVSAGTSSPRASSQANRPQSPTKLDPASSKRIASLLSIIKQSKERGKDQTGTSMDTPPLQQEQPPQWQQQSEFQDSPGRYRERREPLPPRQYEDSPSRRGRNRREPDSRDDWDAGRSAKRSRGSRWGPPKADAADSPRPRGIDTNRDRSRGRSPDRGSRYGPGGSSNYGDRSPRRRPQHNDRDDRRPEPPRQHNFDPMSPPRLDGSSKGRLQDDPPRNPPPQYPNRASPSSRYQSLPPGAMSGRGPPESYDNQGPDFRPNRAPMNPPHRGDDRMRPPTPVGRPRNAAPGEKIPGTSGEMCRKFMAGRCSFGDRCWHIHDPNAPPPSSAPPKPRVEMNDARRKTMLCANYPGSCRFGDRCSFAHGEQDLDRDAITALGKRGGPHGEPTSQLSYDSRQPPYNPEAGNHGYNGWDGSVPSGAEGRDARASSSYDYPPQGARGLGVGNLPHAGAYNEPSPYGERGPGPSPTSRSYSSGRQDDSYYGQANNSGVNGPNYGGPYADKSNPTEDRGSSQMTKQPTLAPPPVNQSSASPRHTDLRTNNSAPVHANPSVPATSSPRREGLLARPPPQQPVPVAPAMKQQNEDEDREEPTVPEFTLQYDDDD
ncbi:TPA: hypothetical protein N0F65_006947 [Lagenidium giganteum]|uniref:C3H1-type domain-containing protein n=1 Tax=Lagenidium giganteum TaxID=4803 RepID=A0AAV2ZH65_9STRA|nr:TPA: hypothetical protein N0F65_006947 [Lagenidium giganteum]